MRILLIEDDDVLRDVIHKTLTEAGHRIDAAANMETADHLWRFQPFDMVILDLNLPRRARPEAGTGNALTLLREARLRGDHTPVLILTARNRLEERVAGLEAGADDYMAKPFDLSELTARIRALGRRAIGAVDRAEVGRLSVDRSARRCFIGESPLDLPAREYEVLMELASPPGRVISKQMLSSKLSELNELLADNALEAFVSRLRKKLAGSGARIRTLRGIGYVLERDDA
ncbi:MAG: response regulator transcription factor [Burkholderiales bacterium]|jgi:two-component system OmpR family response regulator|nr:response regulator transcription factor [Nitrosomonadaceae bacterium]